MSGGSISGNNAKLGGGVYAAGTFTMNGGSISGNEATYGGGVYVYSGMTVSGAPTITNNTVSNSANNVYLPNSKAITIGEGGLQEGAAIGVTKDILTGTTSAQIASVQGESKIGETTIKALYPDAGEDQYDFKLNEGNNEILMVAKPHTHCVCGESNCNKEEHNKGQTWTGVSTLSEITKEGYYYLTDNVELTAKWEPATGVVLCLNGKTITGSGGTSAIVVKDKVTFTLTDCADGETGKVTHGENKTGHGVYVYGGGTFNMYGGNITGNNTDGGLGGGVYVDGTFNMYGGSIANNSVTGSDAHGGGVYVNSGTFTVSNDVKIKDNFKGSNPNNVYLLSSNTITIGTGGLTAGAEIGVTTETLPPVKIATVNNENYKNYFVSDATNYYTVFDDGGIYLSTTEELHKHFLCGGNTCSKIGHNEENSTTTFKEWSDATKLPSVEGKYYLTKNVTISNTWTPAIGMVLCLNGHTITCANDGKVINLSSDGIFTLTDCSEHETGKVTHASNTTGGGVYVYGGIFTMYGGSITGNKAGSDNGGGVHVRMSGSRFNMVGGSITDNTASKGGGVYVESVGQFTMSGGSISKNGATNTGQNCNGGGVYVSGLESDMSNFNMKGGSITGNTAKTNGGGVYLGKNCKFTMEGDSIISGNSAQCGGGVCVFGNASTFTMTGGSISNNNASNSAYGSGGGVYMGYGTFTMNGGSITGNNATGNGGGVFVNSSFTVSGATNITGNVKGGTKDTDGNYTGDNKNNVYLPKDKTITIDEKGLKSGANIGVTTEAKPAANNHVKIATYATKDVNYTDIFKSDVTDKGYTITKDEKGNLYLSEHQHSWTYSQESGKTDTIIATCKNCVANSKFDYNGGTLTIEKPTGELTYDGNAKAATVTASDDWKGENTENIIVNYIKQGESTSSNIAPINAGTYTASVTLGGATASVTYTIAKADPQAKDFTFTAPGMIYDGNDKTAEVEAKEGITGMGNVTVKYYKKYTGDYCEEIKNATAVRDAGTYLVKINVAAGDNYNAATDLTADRWTFTINKADYTGELISIDKSVLWTQSYQSEEVDMKNYLPDIDGAEISYATVGTDSDSIIKEVAAKRDSNKVEIGMANDVKVGKTATIKVTITSTNYKDIIAIINVSTRGKAEATVEISDLPDTVTYGQEFTLTSTAKEGGTTLTGGTWSWDYSMDSFKLVKSNANTGTIKLQAIKAGSCRIEVNYSSGTHSGSKIQPVEIQKKTLNRGDLEGIPTSLTKVYDGGTGYTYPTGIAITLTWNKDVQVTESDRNMQIGISANQITFDQSDVGTTTATISLAEAANILAQMNGNYQFASNFTSIKVPAEITKATPTVSGSGTATGTYGQKLSEVTVQGLEAKLNDNTVAGSWALKGAENATLDEVTSSGSTIEYMAVFTPTDTMNYNTVEAKVAVTVNPKAGGSLGTVNLTQKYTDVAEKTYEPDWTKLPDGETWSYNGNVVKSNDSITLGKNDFNADGTTLTYSISGGKAGDIVTFTLTATCSSGRYEPFTITVVVELVEREPQTGFKFENDTKTVTYGDADFTVKATGAKTNKVTYSSENTSVATVNENTGEVTIKGAGTAKITATASATDDYNAATAIYKLTVAKREIDLPTTTDKTYTYNGEAQTYEISADTKYVKISGDATATNANETGYVVKANLNDKVNTVWKDGTIAEKTYNFIIKKAAVTVTVKDKTAYVNDAAPNLTNPKLGDDYTVSGLVGNDPLDTLPELKYVDADGNETTPDMTKAGDTIIRASGAYAGNNYTISYVNGTLTVSTRPSGGHTKNTDVITTGDKDKTTTSPAEVKTDGAGTATAAVSKANQEEILKQVKDNKSSDIVLDISDKDTKGADNIQLELPKSMIDAIANDTAADLTINTEHGKLTVDKDTLDQLSKDAKSSTLRIIITKIKEPTAEQQKLAGDNVQPYRLTIMSGNQTIGSFAGKITVRLPIPEILKDKTVAAVHFDSDGKLTEMPGKRMMIDGIEYYVFETTHFSEFGLVDAVEAGFVKTDDSKDKVKEAKSIVSKMNLTAVTSKTTKKNVKVTVTMNKKTSSDIKALKELGYTVKYRFYRSTKKSAGYKSKITKKTNTYINTAGKKGTRYYYKAQVRVYDSKGKLITTTALKQCSYGTRTWSK